MSKLEFLRIKDDGSLVIRNVRISYAHLFEKYHKQGGPTHKEAKYGATFILPKDTHEKEIAKIQELLLARQKEVFKKRLPAAMLCLRDGDLTGKEEYENAYILVASDKKNKPLTIAKNGKTEITEEDDKLYSGCIVNGMVGFWDQNNEHGQRINANLIGVQYIDAGTRFSSVNRPKADEAFDNEGDDDDGDDGFDD